ncbi:MAG TPA: crotonase [Deltaproteobacteria bacterium]|nr:crotonase [Deltaproteobacteria bacterium]
MALIERRDEAGVRVLTLNRPERRNALSIELVDALAVALGEGGEDQGVRAIVLAGRGEAFCAGGDLGGSMGAGGGFLDGHQDRGRYAALMAQIPRLRVPVIAAIHGVAYGGGLGLVAACDLAVADRDARLGTPEIRVGLFPWIILAALQRDVPRKPLMQMILTGEPIEAPRAQALGLINAVSEPSAALEDACVLAERIASASPAVVALGKAAFHRIADQPYEDALAYMHAQLSLNLLTEDAMEGIGAFLQKRAPEWKGR